MRAILIVGGSGLVGSNLAFALRDGYKVYTTYCKKRMSIPGVTFFPFHVIDRNWGKRLAFNIQPDIVIYCAGTNDVDRVEMDQSNMDNIHNRGCASVLGFCDLFQPKFILISNNYVFDGSRGNYHETDTLM